MEIQKRQEQTQPAAVMRLLQGSTGQALATSNFKEAARLMPSRIENVVDEPKVKEMVRALGERSVQAYIEFELINLADRINVSGNFTPAQVEFVASQLLRLYPDESLADFKICFERGAAGAYGKIFKLAGIEIGQWMAQYLDQKYQVLENQLREEKDTYKNVSVRTSSDWLQLWK